MNNYIKNGRWRTSTGLAFWGVTIQSIFNLIGLGFILYVCYNLIDIALAGILPSIASASLNYYEDRMAAFIVIVVVCGLISFLGYIFYLIGICMFKGAQRSASSNAKARNIMIVELLMPVLLILYYVVYYKCIEVVLASIESAIIYALLPFIGSLAAVIILLIQFGSLSKEETWSEKAKGGAGDVQTSYICLLWIFGVLILGFGMMALSIYSFISNLDSIQHSGYGYQDMFEGVNTLSRKVNDLLTTVKVEAMFTSFGIFILGSWSTIKRIVGWRMIQNGGNEEVYGLSSQEAPYTGPGRFCHKCGMQLPEGSAFCPGCGTPVTVASIAESVESVQEQPTDSETAERDAASIESATQSYSTNIVYEDEESDNKKKLMLWGGIAAGVIAVAFAIWAICFRSDKMEANAKVFADRSVVFKSIEDGVGLEPIEELKYDTDVECRKSELDLEGIWTKVAFLKDGKVTTGYIPKADLLNNDEFVLLKNAGMSDSDVREGLPYNIERLALLNALKSNGSNWHLEELIQSGQGRPNSKRLIVRGVSPSEDCLGFILRNNDTGERTFFLYSTPDIYSPGNTREPVYLYSEPVIGDWDEVYDVTLKKRGRYEVIYMKTTEETYESDSFLYEGSAMDDEPEENERQFIGTVEMSGLVDGKYPVKMQLTMDAYNKVSGTITYVKYNVPMGITGTYTDTGAGYDLSLEEMSDGKVTGNFIGSYDGREFSGSWVSADGAKEMPFRVQR